uniref:Uncharacterized protein n=1 Tax=Aegilops tauschii TaxID=37682 RepID=M8AR62_AEGTA
MGVEQRPPAWSKKIFEQGQERAIRPNMVSTRRSRSSSVGCGSYVDGSHSGLAVDTRWSRGEAVGMDIPFLSDV